MSGLVLGLLLIGGGLGLFKYQHAIIEQNLEIRTGRLGRWWPQVMRAGDRITFPMMAGLLILLGLALMVFTVFSAVVGRG